MYKKCTKRTKNEKYCDFAEIWYDGRPYQGDDLPKIKFFENVKNEGVMTKNGSKMVKK